MYAPAEKPMNEPTHTSSKRDITVVVFAVAGDLYAIPASCAREVMLWQQPRKLPGSPSWVEGVVNLRGSIIPVCDLAQALGLRTERPRTEDTSIVIVSVEGGESAGFTVDAVTAVTSYRPEDIVDAPDASHPAMSGIVRTGDDLVVLLDVDHALEGASALMDLATVSELAADDSAANQSDPAAPHHLIDTPDADERPDERTAA